MSTANSTENSEPQSESQNVHSSSEVREQTADAGSGDSGQQEPQSVDTTDSAEPDPEKLVQELQEKILRMAAENQNTRKRLVKQQQDAYKYRHQDILADLTEIMDNFDRAIESSEGSRDFDTFHEGIVMIEKQFSGILTEKYGLERIGTEGELFDPEAHEAVMMVESPDVEEPSVKEVFQSGYRLHDRVLRAARVVVVKQETKELDAQLAEDSKAVSEANKDLNQESDREELTR